MTHLFFFLAGPHSVDIGPGGSVLALDSGIDGTQLSLGGANGLTIDQNGITRNGQAAAAIGNQIVVIPQTGQKSQNCSGQQLTY